MSALLPHHERQLDRLALIIQRKRPEQLSCTNLLNSFLHANKLNDRGVPRGTLLLISREYARRVDKLGPDEFDRLVLLGL